jgi:hypothetical protein
LPCFWLPDLRMRPIADTVAAHLQQ